MSYKEIKPDCGKPDLLKPCVNDTNNVTVSQDSLNKASTNNVIRLEITSPQVDNGHLRLANELLEELITRDFSKRQLNIIFFILRLSWACGKKYAIIPNLKDFEVCGIRRQHITKELEILQKTRVIYWNREVNLFALNKYYEYWTINPVTKTVTATIKALITKQLTVTKTVTQKITELLKQESGVTEIVTSWLLKQLLFDPEKPGIEQEKIPPKESIKEIKEKNTNKEENSSFFTEILEAFKRECPSLKTPTKLTQTRTNNLKARIKEYPSLDDWITLFKKTEESDFLTNRNKNNRDNWEASFDWLIQNSDNSIKVLEDKYINKENASNNGFNDFTLDELKHLSNVYDTSMDNIKARTANEKDKFIKTLQRDRIR